MVQSCKKRRLFRYGRAAFFYFILIVANGLGLFAAAAQVLDAIRHATGEQQRRTAVEWNGGRVGNAGAGTTATGLSQRNFTKSNSQYEGRQQTS